MAAEHILLIEDEEPFRTVLQKILISNSYQVTVAVNGAAGRRCLQQASFDLVITDIMMHELNGFEVMEYIAAHTPDVPVIVITGYTSTESVIEAFHKGAYDYIPKPFRIETLLRPVERALEKVRLQRQLQRRMAELAQRLADLQATTVSKRFVENIVRSMADMLIVLQTDGTIQTVNEAVTSILGYQPEDLLDKPFALVCPDNMFADGDGVQTSPTVASRGARESTYRTRDGRPVPVSCSWTPLSDEQGAPRGIVCIAQDITERKRTEETLRGNEAWLRLLTGQMPAMLWTTDTALKLTTFLGADVTRSGLAPSQLKGLPLHELFPMNGARALQGEPFTQEIQHGALLFHAHVEPLYDAAEQIIGTIGVALDISQHKRQEEERRKIAYELHDGAAQLMVSAQQHLDTCDALWQREPGRAHEHLLKGQDRLGQAIVEARRLMAQLHSVVLETLGLLPAVQRYLEELNEEAGWQSEFSAQVAQLELVPEAELGIFRIIQEALTNAWKHAQTARIRVSLSTDDTPPSTLYVTIQDWGVGFVVSRVSGGSQHLGLQGIHERAQALGGVCRIESCPGQGTVVQVRIPLSSIDRKVR